MKPVFIAIFAILTFSFNTNAQFSVNGKLTDAEGAPLGFANVLLLSAADSSFVVGAISAEDGSFALKASEEGHYRLSASSVGFETYYSSPFPLSENQPNHAFDNIVLQPGGVQLETVQVRAERPLFIKKIDRTILDIENRVTSSGISALEVLERSPGIVVNRQSNSIAMLGKEGVNVMVNGKLNYMPAEALFSFLAGLNASNISKIELITTPPASLDAQGNAGYINIILKSNPNDGLNGNYTLSLGYGRGETGNASASFNYRKNKANLFGSYTYLRNGQEQFTSLRREIGPAKTALTSDRRPVQNNQNARLGLDYQAGKRTTLGLLLSGYSNRWDMEATNEIQASAPSENTSITSLNNEDNDWQHLQANLNMTHHFENNGTWSADLDYLFYDNKNPVTYDITYRDANNGLLAQENVRSSKVTPFNIIVGKSDLELPISRGAKLSTGVKLVRSNFENDVLVERDEVEIPEFTSESDLTESIVAAYVQMGYQLSEKTTFRGGLRYEYTDTELRSSREGKVVDRAFGALFPSLSLSHQFNDANSLGLSYSKRINRPAFSDMAPFVIFLSPSISFGGNAALQPAIAHSFQVDYRLKTLLFSAQYTREDSTIVRFQNRFSPAANTQLILPDNLQRQQTFTASAAFPVRINDWWKMRYFGMYTWQEATSVEELGTFVFSQHSLRFNGSQAFLLPQDFSIELSGFYQTTTLVGNVKFAPLGILNLGIQKKLSNDARLAFSVNDIFNSLKRTGVTEITGEGLFVSRTFDFSQRTFQLTYTATFGNSKVKDVRQRDSGAEERGRVN